MQQTRVEQGLPYFHRFIESFPTIFDLAKANENDVLANWQGLGYYSRARNMQHAAKYVVNECDGVFPANYKDILKLKGVGPYTAAAISSICFDIPEPVVDGNVFRVASRAFGIKDDISKSSSRSVFVETLKKIIPQKDPGSFNQAMMEHGATVCKPSPTCEICTLREYCFAFQNKEIQTLPVKTKKLKVKERPINYLVIEHQGNILMKKRSEKDIWQGMYDFPEASTISEYDFSAPIIHLLSHQRLTVRFAHISVSREEFAHYSSRLVAEPFSIKQVLTLPKPKVIVDFVDKTFES